MTTYNNTLKLLAAKLGLGEEEKVLNKAAEFERLLQTKSAPGSIMTDTSKVVICLDLAAALFGSSLDNKTAIKYSGLKGPSYANCRKIVENLLEINNNKLSIASLCLTLQCSGIQELAKRILEEYTLQAKTEIDLDLPQYACMAVYQACRVNKKKVSKSKVIEKSRLRPAQWAKLDADWSKFVDEKFASVEKKGKVQKNAAKNDENSMEVETSCITEEKTSENKIEPYEDWKKRMLEEAYKELKLLEKNQKEDRNMKEDVPTRRSPRKTPQKFSPYKHAIKSPRKVGGIRLLFPKDD